ncbi:hypothetical protein MFLO_10913 [Listeria floridensis FSL S10-1187]|uniref:Uncharacterized protein n=1 Tax=Listeria floridensis FSL S10-1187 TaxID=1265817 RepID=A0ABP3AZ32_9LIST|nr:hypothetical protein [Listeria floridensis]EUJ30326.1 hypothetical protein MFLO_10913 [Listeria floridensis FSL S10-1187]
MEIKVQNKIQDSQIVFTSDFGECIATWADDEDPDPGRKYTVEVTIPNKITFEDLFESDEKHCLLESEEDLVHIVGKLEDYEEDGFAVLRLEESIICFDSVFDEQIEQLHGKFIDLFVPKIELTSVGI